MLGYFTLAILPALVTVTTALRAAAPQSMVSFDPRDKNCVSLYSLSGSFLRVGLESTNLFFQWYTAKEEDVFSFWYDKTGAKGGFWVKRGNETAMPLGRADEINRLFAGLNPYAHLVKEILNKYNAPLKKEDCEELMNSIDSNPPDGYEDAGRDWLKKFIDDKRTEFFERFRKAKEAAEAEKPKE
ncbi:hypothetical protein FOL46_002875 [Perkinsus olseni]|uniref:Uncharacterized protein n=1 Tax=Perkinsus olseni TaxID=32597 RepID=A0A7J6M5E2_PEROL|nr:hypothetical protein FOL46_002875 [Perkinsus olseni]